MRGWLAKKSTLFNAEAWLEDAQRDVTAGNYERVWKALLSWRKAVGKPGDPMKKRLLKGAQASIEAEGKAEPTSEEIGSYIEELRERIARTLLPVERAYLLNKRFKWQLRAGDITTFVRSDRIHNFLVRANKYARQHDLHYEERLTPPHRSVGNYGWSGSAWMKVEGNAVELQNFVDEVCCFFVGADGERFYRLYPAEEFVRQNRKSAAMGDIPSYETAAKVMDGFVQVPLESLREGVERTAVKERQRIEKGLQAALARKQQAKANS